MTGIPTVTVVLAVRNAGETLDPCLRSLLALEYPTELLEVLVVENGSSDATRSILERFAKRVRVVHESRRGPAPARNRGVDEASGEVIAFTDADCTVDPAWLTWSVPRAMDPTVGIVAGRILAQRPCNAVQEFGERIHDQRRAVEEFVPPYAAGGNWCSRAAVLREAGLFDPELRRGSDAELAFRIVATGYRIVFEPNAVVYHRNEATLAGLFREGFVHGFHAVPIRRRHLAFIRAAQSQQPPTGVGDPPQTARELYEVVFRAGKRMGRLCGEASRGAFSGARSLRRARPTASRCSRPWSSRG